MTDRSLDEFAPDSTDDKQTDESDDGGPDQPEKSAPEPATATARVSPDGAACETCGETVRRRWHDDGTYVCRECKEW